MIFSLSGEQRRQWRELRKFAEETIAPAASDIDESEVFPVALIRQLGAAGWLASMLPSSGGRTARSATSYGMMTEELGRTCSNTRNFVAVQDMVAHAVWQWGTESQKSRWINAIAAGSSVAAFLLTEPDVGSDAANVKTQATRNGDEIVINGRKKWISFGALADVFLVFAQYEGRHTALLVERRTPGVRVIPTRGMLGLRGSMLAEISFDNCRVPVSSILGSPGAGLVFVGSSSLDIGRYSTAWGCVGLAQAGLDASVSYAAHRMQFGKRLDEQPLILRFLADMLAESQAARLLCWNAGQAMEHNDIDSVQHTLIAKYSASRSAARTANHAVQIHGATGMGEGSEVGRLFRDSKAMEIIEGTTQVLQSLVGQWSSNARHPADDETTVHR